MGVFVFLDRKTNVLTFQCTARVLLPMHYFKFICLSLPLPLCSCLVLNKSLPTHESHSLGDLPLVDVGGQGSTKRVQGPGPTSTASDVFLCSRDEPVRSSKAPWKSYLLGIQKTPLQIIAASCTLYYFDNISEFFWLSVPFICKIRAITLALW